ncbi:unnamed protein product [Miscanthus lutarioriparius]|uniref:Uncharacterized protein n=1 Tax=Miscanthus lutarioriparius TaxID=422564 RepID=A0A811N806_9POAL|nr:unnamed protein product [Miscanthus lutarioriparius]
MDGQKLEVNCLYLEIPASEYTAAEEDSLARLEHGHEVAGAPPGQEHQRGRRHWNSRCNSVASLAIDKATSCVVDMSCFQGFFFCPKAASLLLHNFCGYHITPQGHKRSEKYKRWIMVNDHANRLGNLEREDNRVFNKITRTAEQVFSAIQDEAKVWIRAGNRGLEMVLPLTAQLPGGAPIRHIVSMISFLGIAITSIM